MTTRQNALDQALDIAGSLLKDDGRTLSDEVNGFGAALAGQSGSVASITTFSAGVATMTGLTGMSAESVGRFMSVAGAAAGGNNGTFLIVNYISATSVDVANAAGSAPDGNNGAISWVERGPYSLEDDINFVRTDRKLIKGTAGYDDVVPTYERPTAVGTNVPANLSNVASKTTDAKAIVTNRKYENATVAATNTFITLSDVGNLPHADAVDRTGVPIHDGADVGNYTSTYAEIIDPDTEGSLEVQAGGNAGERIYGRMRAGSSTEPDSVEVEFLSVPKGDPLGAGNAYAWEAGQPTTIDIFYPFRERLDNLDENALRVVLSSGVSSDAGLNQALTNLRKVVGDNLVSTDTDLSGELTNTGNYFPFSDLPDATPSVVEALNTLNEQIGDRNFTDAAMTDGWTVTQAINYLATAAANAGATRTIERVAADINAGTPHTIPGGASYTLDGTDNGLYMWVFWRGVLRDPGPVASGNDYAETSTTQITPYSKIKKDDHISYFILQ